MNRGNPTLQLEFLEARMLLSSIDIPQDAITAGVKDGAIDSTDSHVQVDWNAGAQRLTITGPHDGDLTVNLDDLPANVIVLQVFSFDSVKLTGQHTFKGLILADVRSADAGGVSTGYLEALGVEHIKIDNLQSDVWLSGSDSLTSVGDRTLLEANSIKSGITIVSYVETLGLVSNGPVETFSLVNGVLHPTVLLNFVPAIAPSRSGFDDPESEISVVTGDFSAYFLALPSERAALEQSLLVSRHPVVTNSVPLATLLADSALGAILASETESGANPLANRAHTLAVNGSGQTALAPLFSESLTSHEAESATSANIGFEVLSTSTGLVPVQPATRAAANAGLLAFGPMKLGMLNSADLDAHSAERFGEAISSAMHAFSSRLAQPFAQFAGNFGDHLATFGDLVVAHFAEHLKVEYQYALLVDARPIRMTDEREIQIITI